jgi:hypothetical protein
MFPPFTLLETTNFTSIGSANDLIDGLFRVEVDFD